MDVFFISYREHNCETNWQNVLRFHPNAKRLHGIKGIDNAHLICDKLCDQEYFFTIDGDNWLLESLDYTEDIEADMTMFKAIDPLFSENTLLGGVKLWRKGSIVNPNMSKGDFTLNATRNKKVKDKIFSITKYNTSEFDAWKTAFRHCVKLMSCIFRNRPNANNIQMYIDRWKSTKDIDALNSGWAYRGYLDSIDFVKLYDNTDKLNFINDFDWLEKFFEERYGAS